MNSDNRSIRRALGIIVASAALGCLGPWNIETENMSPRFSLHVSCLLVADRPLDTLWIERSQPFTKPYSAMDPFIDTAASKVLVIRTFPSPAETTVYRLSAENQRAWIPASDPVPRVEVGARYRLFGNLRWNASEGFPQEKAYRIDTLESETYVQSGYSIPDSVQAPIEFLHPSLALGLPPAMVRRALDEPEGYLGTLFDSLDATPEAGSLRKRGITREDFQAYLRGELVTSTVKRGDTLQYIWDDSKVSDKDGEPITRYFRGLSIIQEFDPEQYGGLIIIQGFDTTRAYINNPIDQEAEFQQTPGKIDTPSYYQRGNSRVQEVLPKTIPGRNGYPKALDQSNLLFGYTGRNVLYFYAVDSLYYEYYRRYKSPGDKTLLPYSNVENGDGYFIGAVLDSLSFVLTSQRDTIPVSDLRRAWLKSKGSSK